MLNRRVIIIASGLLWTAPFARAQFYNETRDKKAQEAEAAARQIASGLVFEKETKNIDALSKLQIQGQLDLARVNWLSALDNFTTWDEVKRQLATVKSGLATSALPTLAERQARLGEIKEQQATLKEALKKLQESETKDPAIIAVLDSLDQGEALVKVAERLAGTNNSETAEAFDRITEALSVAKSLYSSWKTAREAIKAANEGVAALAVPREQLELDMLAIEVNQLNQLGIIAARRAVEAEEILKVITEGEGNLVTAGVSNSTANIEDTLRAEKDRVKLYFQLQALHIAASAAIRNTLPEELAKLRRTQDEWRSSVRESSTVAKNYEQIILASAQRIALYYKGGIKPGQIAQLLYNLSGLVSLPILAAK